jgi:hypothetical protein
VARQELKKCPFHLLFSFPFVYFVSKRENMAQIGTLTSGAGVTTSISGLSQLEEFLVIGDADTAMPLQGLTVEQNGETLFNCQNQALLGAFAKWLQEICGAVVGLMFKLATGRIKGSTNLRLINSGATTPGIFAFSDSDGGRPVLGGQEVILAGSNTEFTSFDALFITAPANIQQAVVTFSDGFQTIMTPAEIGAYFSLNNQAEADGYLNGCAVIDNSKKNIQSVRLFATGANLTVLKVIIPNI